ncbi:hypothetical protein BU23DRAFT_443973 [Bimuria novae-zelandiae CBS 107.79]|uniref:MOSC domain-containing protein n=1 Tax=Bimuria novae-zelandiae CBS 107.79 TaxID=1447943 RepID=A0A6A5VSF8_9PLEO|nr:hypothetical protein BU23DRAFT_443973 [Bimuria novae-zelandiae CBS 107.79]
MASNNLLDNILNSIPKTWHDIGLPATPIALLTTFLALLLPLISLYLLALSQREEPPPPPAGCRKLNKSGVSNLADQFLKKYDHGGEPSASNPWRVKALMVYPLKSCTGVELDKAEVRHSGLKYDRQFTFAQQVTSLPTLEGKVESQWTIITLRQVPRLAKVEVEMWIPDPEAPGYENEGEWVKSEGCLVARFPFTPDTDYSVNGMKNYGKILAAKSGGKSEPMVEFRIPFNPTKERMKSKGYRKEPVKIFNDVPIALNVGCEIPEETMAQLKYTLGVSNPLTLFRIDPDGPREVLQNAPKKEDVGFQPAIGMQDAHPVQIQNLAAIHDVSSKVPSKHRPLNALRYRPNIIFTGPPAFAEDNWKMAKFGPLTLDISCRTTRCKLPNVDPLTGVADRNEPGTTMRKYRVIDKGSKLACLGMQVTPLEEGIISVGDEIEVLETGDHYFVE